MQIEFEIEHEKFLSHARRADCVRHWPENSCSPAHGRKEGIMWLQYGCMGFLGICAVYDFRIREIPTWIFVVFGLFGIGTRIYFGSFFTAGVLAGVCFGIVFWILGTVSHGKVGQGDGLMLIVNGIYMGIWQSIEVCLLALLFLALSAAGMLFLKKITWKTEMPFAPFLLIAYSIYLIIGATGW